MAYGVVSTGFVPKTLTVIKEELEAAFRAVFGESIDLTPQSNFSQIIGVMAERYSDLWEQAENIYNAFTPDGAVGASLDNLAAITGTTREPATASQVAIMATGTPGTVLPVGRIASVEDIGTRFETLVEGTIVAVSAWASTTAYAVDDLVYNDSPENVYVCTTAGTSAGSGGPTGETTDIGDETVVWDYVGDGTGAVAIDAESEDTGPKVATARTLNVIETPVAGWSSVLNLLDATLGSDEETDSALRVRREDELRGNGLAAVEAIRTAVLAVDNVTTCMVFENVDDIADGDGIPAHAVEALVQGGDDDAIREALFASVAAGIKIHGDESGTVTDSQGIDHTVAFTRPTEKNVWVIVNATVDEDYWPEDGEDQVKAAIVEWGDAQRTGKDVVAAAISAQAFSVSGMLDAEVLIAFSNPPGASTTLAIALRELAVYDTSRITVNATPGTP